MSKQEDRFRRYERSARLKKKLSPEEESRPSCCADCLYRCPDFKYRRCMFARCPYGISDNVFRDKPLKRDRFIEKEAAKMHG